MYKLLIRKVGKKNWKLVKFDKTVRFAKNGLIRTADMAKFLATVYKTAHNEVKIVKVN